MREKMRFILLVLVAVTISPSLQDDSSEEEDDCLLPPVKPMPIACLAFMKKWTFNKNTGKCEEFIYGGCGGTANLFGSEAQCLAKCNKKSLTKSKGGKSVSVCQLPRLEGACRSFTKRYYFDSTTNECKEFTYGGCHGNANNFQTLEECHKVCPTPLIQKPIFVLPRKTDEKAAKDKSVCSLPPIQTQGFACQAYIPKWTFNSDTQMCERYIYGGCGGTGNLFNTQQECQAVCQSQLVKAITTRSNCLLPVEGGNCYASMRRYAFKKDKNRCELFTYGGCGGNSNNFHSEDECFNACGGDVPSSDIECEIVNCHPEKYAHYIERGCRPVYKAHACCPTSFSCPEPETTEGQCNYRGIWYKDGEPISQIAQDNPCQKDCICKRNPDNPEMASIECTETLCSPPPEGCIPLFKDGQCCPDTFKCQIGSDNSKSSEEVDMCYFNGKEYVKGQQIDTSSIDPCKFCICATGFIGLDSPNCRDIHCRIDHRPGCVPVYSDGVCCPVDYHCPQEMRNSSVIIPVETKHGAITLPAEVTDITESTDSEPAIKAGGAVTLPAEVNNPESEAATKKGPFIKAGNAVTLPAVVDHSESEAATKKGPFIKAGGAVTLPTVVDHPESEAATKKGPFIKSGSAVTLPAAVPGGRKAKSDTCLLPVITGHCRARKLVFHYDADKGDCFQFTYGGCGGNGNRFESMEACLQSCKPDSTPEVSRSGPFIKVGSAVTLPALVPGGRSGMRAKEERCLLPSEVGPCRGFRVKYYFDADLQDCLEFGYGGCKGNDNRFENREECLQTCQLGTAEPRSAITEINVCNLEQLVGPCRGQIPSYFYNSVNGTCDRFYYGGCYGNGNRFQTIEECQSRCLTNGTVGARTVDTKSKDVCHQPKVIGPCRGSKNRFFFNSETNACEKFIYGGCKGNGNNFHTQTECEEACLSKDPVEAPTSRSSDICQLPAVVGSCRAAVPKFFFNSETQECQRFTYGGCGGNNNNFDTIEECQSACGTKPESRSVHGRARQGHSHDHKEGKYLKCKLPADPGFCRGFKNRFYYDITDHSCKTFVWGGCLGNGNNFATEAECLHECGQSDKPSDDSIHPKAGEPQPPVVTESVCELPIDIGPCRSIVEQYGYNKATGECQPFNYGGCAGNGNRFATLGECQAQCPSLQGITRARKLHLDQTCTYGNDTLHLGDRVMTSDPCIECICDIPPEVSCTKKVCPPLPPRTVGICKTREQPGQCCPAIACVSANPPVIDVCEGVVCTENQRCKVQSQTKPDGSWAMPIGVCVDKE